MMTSPKLQGNREWRGHVSQEIGFWIFTGGSCARRTAYYWLPFSSPSPYFSQGTRREANGKESGGKKKKERVNEGISQRGQRMGEKK